MRIFYLTAFVLGLTSFGLGQGTTPRTVGSKIPIWSVNDSSRTQLGDAAAVEAYLVNPPKGYTRAESSHPDGALFTAWVSETRADGTRAQLMVMTFSINYEVVEADLEPALANLVDRMQVGRSDYKRGAIEHGFINGHRFVRTRWEGFDTTLKRKIFAFNYLTVVGKQVVDLSSQDVEPFQEASLALAEAAAQTFRKK